MSLAFHGKDMGKIALLMLNESTYNGTPIRQVSYTTVDQSERFIAIKNSYLRPLCERHEQALSFKLSRLAI